MCLSRFDFFLYCSISVKLTFPRSKVHLKHSVNLTCRSPGATIIRLCCVSVLLNTDGSWYYIVALTCKSERLSGQTDSDVDDVSFSKNKFDSL